MQGRLRLAALGSLLLAGSTVPSHASLIRYPSADAATERVLYAFQGGSDGAGPGASLIIDKGSLYGTAAYGGDPSCPNGCGTVFKLAPSGSGYMLSVLYSFKAKADGNYPQTNLYMDRRGDLYGTTTRGSEDAYYYGTVFRLVPGASGYRESILYGFTGHADGDYPNSGLVADSSGALYGTTQRGGSGGCEEGCGTVFELTPNGSGYSEHILRRFTASGENHPQGVLLDRSGALFGTTAGGSHHGTVYKLTRHGDRFVATILYRFRGGSDGSDPQAGLMMDAAGALYGTTWGGGGSTACRDGCGTVFRLTPSGSSYVESVLYRFRGRMDGNEPDSTLVADASGALYGATDRGGGHVCMQECGIVFKLTPAGSGYTEQVLHRFAGGTGDGADVDAGLVLGSQGALYGTTFRGGGAPACGYNRTILGCGTIFQVTP